MKRFIVCRFLGKVLSSMCHLWNLHSTKLMCKNLLNVRSNENGEKKKERQHTTSDEEEKNTRLQFSIFGHLIFIEYLPNFKNTINFSTSNHFSIKIYWMWKPKNDEGVRRYTKSIKLRKTDAVENRQVCCRR